MTSSELEAPAKRRRSWRRRAVLFGLPALIVAIAAWQGIDYYLTEVPKNLAEDYVEASEPAFDKVERSMDRVFKSWDGYLANSTVPKGKIKDKTAKQARKVLLPLYAERRRRLDRANRAINLARRRIKEAAPILADTPSQTALDGKEPLVLAREAAADAKDYFKRARRFLGSFSGFTRYEKRNTALFERSLKIRASVTDPDDSIDAHLDSLRSVVDRMEKVDADRRALEPHRDTKKLYATTRRFNNAYVRYIEGILDGFDNLSQAQLDAAQARFDRETKDLDGRDSRLLQALRTKSGLSSATESLPGVANGVELALSHVASASD